MPSQSVGQHVLGFIFGSVLFFLFHWLAISANSNVVYSASKRLANSFASYSTPSHILVNTPILYIAGDESIAHGGLTPADRSHGFGEYLHEYLSLPIRNHGIPGATARTFVESGQWDRLAWHLREHDMLIFAFGGNDEGWVDDGSFDGHSYSNDDIDATTTYNGKTIHTYQHYMLHMLNTTLAQSAIPILSTGVHTNTWDWNSKSLQDGKWLCQKVYDPLLASRTGSTLLDMYGATRRLYQDVGIDEAAPWSYGLGSWIANIAVNEQGARAFAREWIRLLLCKKGSEAYVALEPYLTQKARDEEVVCKD